MKEETLDEMLQRLSMECMEEAKRLNAAESGTEQFEEMVENINAILFMMMKDKATSPKDLISLGLGAYAFDKI